MNLATIMQWLEGNVMSVHLRANSLPLIKAGSPGNWELRHVSNNPLTNDELEELIEDIYAITNERENAFVEVSYEFLDVIQLEDMRIVISRPPLSDAIEITIVHPTTIKTLEEYHLSKELFDRLQSQAEGILIAGSPGAGKSTFAAALANYYASQGKIVKTMEKPRDLNVSENITQYTMIDGDPAKTGDILLLLRPDYVIYDELRKTIDFAVYSDMRLAGVGLVGVVHATKPIDAVQRFVGRIDVGLIPSIVDTVLFIQNGEVSTALTLSTEVKVPTGFKDDSLARPVIEIRDFLTHELLYEMYSFGEHVTIIPIKGKSSSKARIKKTIMRIEKQFFQLTGTPPLLVEHVRNNRYRVYIDDNDIPRIIGAGGSRITEIERMIGGVSLDIVSERKLTEVEKQVDQVTVGVVSKKKNLILVFPISFAGKNVNLYVGGDHFGTFTVNSNGEIRMSLNNKLAKEIKKKVSIGKDVTASLIPEEFNTDQFEFVH